MNRSTRRVVVPTFVNDDEDTVVVDDPDREAQDDEEREPTMIGIGVSTAVPLPVTSRNKTQDLDQTLREPAESRYHITAGFWIGADTDVIADSLARDALGPSETTRITLRRRIQELRARRASGDRALADALEGVLTSDPTLGDQWVIGSAWAARNWLVQVMLSDPDVPLERQMVAWRPARRTF